MRRCPMSDINIGLTLLTRYLYSVQLLLEYKQLTVSNFYVNFDPSIQLYQSFVVL